MLINLIGERRREVVSINMKRSQILLTNLTTNKSKTFEEKTLQLLFEQDCIWKNDSNHETLILKHICP